MFELLPAGFSVGIWSDRHGVIERHPTLGVSGSAFDPGDIASDCRGTRSANICAQARWSQSSRFQAGRLRRHKLSGWLKVEAAKSRKQKRTTKQLHADLISLGLTAPIAAWPPSSATGKPTGSANNRPAGAVSVRLERGLGDPRRRAHQVAGGALQVVPQPRFHRPGLSAANPRDAV